MSGSDENRHGHRAPRALDAVEPAPIAVANGACRATQANSTSDSTWREFGLAVPGVLFEASLSADGRLTAPPRFAGRLAEVFAAAAGGIADDPRDAWSLIHADDRQRLSDAIALARQSGVGDCEIRALVNGDEIWLRISMSRQPLDGGGDLWRGMAIDTSNSHRQLERGEQDARNFRVLCESAPLGIFECDRRSTIIYHNRQMLEIAGIAPSDDVLSAWVNTIHPEDLPPLIKDWPKPVLVPHVYRLLTRHRGTRWVRAQLTAMQWDTEGTPTRYVGTVVDITDQKTIEEGLRASQQALEAHVAIRTEELSRANQLLSREAAERKQAELERRKFVSLVEHSGNLIALVDLEGRLLFLNQAGRALVGLEPPASIIGLGLADLLPPHADTGIIQHELEEVRQHGRWTGETEFVNRRTGQTFVVQASSFLIADPEGDPPLCIATVRRDVTDRKRGEESVRGSEERFRQLAENIDEVFWIAELEPSRLLYVSPAYETIWQRPLETAYSNPYAFLENVHTDDRSRVEQALPKIRLGHYEDSYRIVRADGSIRAIRSRGFPIRNERGDVYRVAGIVEDITERMEVEEELRSERHFLHHLLHLQEGERKLIAYDIHDGFLQGVIAAVMHLDTLNEVATPAEANGRLDVPLELLREAIEEARRMISGLRPPILDEQGLIAAIEFLIQERRTRATKVLFFHSVEFHRLEGVLEGTLFRIVQEALTNVDRHSQAQLAQVSLVQDGERLTLVVEDWGRGFDPEQAGGRQFGLRGIRERAILFGGTCTVESQLGLGTRIGVELPLRRPLATPVT